MHSYARIRIILNQSDQWWFHMKFTALSQHKSYIFFWETKFFNSLLLSYLLEEKFSSKINLKNFNFVDLICLSFDFRFISNFFQSHWYQCIHITLTRIICISYCTVLSTIWPIFSEFLIFCWLISQAFRRVK